MKYTYTQNDHRIFAGFYESILFYSDMEYYANENLKENENDEYELKDFDGYRLDVTKQIVDNLLSSCIDDLILKSIEFKELVSLTYYNFETDRLRLELNLDRDLLEEYIFNTHANKFNDYINKKYSSCDGFASFIANNIHDFKNQYLIEQKVGRCPSNIAAMVLCATRFDFDDEYFTFTLSGLESYAHLHDLIDFDKLSQFIEKNQDFLFRDCVKKDIIGRLDGLSYEQICKVNDFIDDIV